MSKLSQPSGWITRKNGSWIAHVNLVTVNSETGEKSRRHVSKVIGRVSDTTKAQARMLKNKFVIETVGCGNGLRPDSRTTLSEFVKGVFIPERSANWRKASKDTTTHVIEHYILNELGDVPLSEFTTTRLQLFLNGLKNRGFCSSLVARIRTLLRAIFRLALDRKFILENVAANTFLPKIGQRAKRTLSRDELKLLLENLDDPMDRCLFALAVCAGLRSSEVFGLVWRAIKRDTRSLQICSIAYEQELYLDQTKTKGSGENFAIPDGVWKDIETWESLCPDTSPDSLVFPYVLSRGKRKGQAVPWDAYHYMVTRIKPVAISLGISGADISCQVFRRTYCTDLQKYGSLKDVQMLARHSSATTTLGIYIQPIDETARNATNARWDGILAPAKLKGVDAGKDSVGQVHKSQRIDTGEEEDEYDMWV